jgi:hypothetical protein
MSSYPSPAGKASMRRSPPMAEKLQDPRVVRNHLRMETRNRRNGKGILGILLRPPERCVSFCTYHPYFSFRSIVWEVSLSPLSTLRLFPLTRLTNIFLSLISLNSTVKTLKSGQKSVKSTSMFLPFLHVYTLGMPR